MRRLVPLAVVLVALAGAETADAKRSPGKISYLTTGRLQQIRAVSGDGKVDRLLVKFDSALFDPHLSPNGRRIAYTRDSDDRVLIRTLGRRGARKLVGPNGDDPSSLGDWSPDGRMLELGGEANKPEPPGGIRHAFFVIGANGKGLREIPLNEDLASFLDWDTSRRWYIIRGAPGPQSIWSLDINTGAQTKVVDLAPDSNGLAFSHNGRLLAYTDPAGLWVAHRDGSGRRKLAGHIASYAGSLTWRPDNGAVAFVRNKSGVSDIYKVNLSGRGLKRLTHSGHAISPDWAPGTLRKRH
jgi:Tol biopolymer transport system component